MIFRGVSETKDDNNKGSGGCVALKKIINQEYTAAKSEVYSNELFKDNEFHIPYGIIDNDNAEQNHISKNSRKEKYPSFVLDRTVKPDFKIKEVPNRYSIENFLFDPLIFSFFFCNYINSLYKDEFNKLYTKYNREFINIEEEISKNIKEIKYLKTKKNQYKLWKICYEITLLVTNLGSMNDLQLKIDQYFKFLHKMYNNKSNGEKIYDFIDESNLSDSDKKALDIDFIENVNKTKLKNSVSIPIIFLIEGKFYQKLVQYPKLFLTISGHDLEPLFNKFYSKSSANILTDIISIYFYKNKLSVLPLDLANTYFDLDDKIRRNIKPAIQYYLHFLVGDIDDENLKEEKKDLEESNKEVIFIGKENYDTESIKIIKKQNLKYNVDGYKFYFIELSNKEKIINLQSDFKEKIKFYILNKQNKSKWVDLE